MGKLRDALNASFTDRVDCSLDISLFEYGIIRNPKTGRVIYCIPAGESGKEYLMGWTTIEVDNVVEVLADMPDGFFSYIDSDKETEIQNAKDWPNDLASIIQSIDSYNGWWKDACQFESNRFALRRLARGVI